MAMSPRQSTSFQTETWAAGQAAAREAPPLPPPGTPIASGIVAGPGPSPIIPPVDLTNPGWTSLLRAGAEFPVFDRVSIINTPLDDSDAASKSYVDTLFASGGGVAGVASFNTRTGAVVLTSADVASAGGATLASPAFTGAPTAPTASLGTNSTQLATTAFVAAAVTAGTAGVASFNTRTGAVVLTMADIAAIDFRTLPTADPGNGRLWINGGGGNSGALWVGPA